MFALAAYYGWYIEHLDTVTAYLNFDIDVLLYVKFSDGYKEPGKAALLRKTIYGLKQSACQWHRNPSAKLLKASFLRLMSNYSIFICNAGSSKMIIVVIYIDDFLVFGLDKSEIDNIKWWLNINYKMKDLGTCCQFLGMKVEQEKNRCTISISQIAFINKTLMAAEIQDCKGVIASIIGFPNFS